MDPIKKELYTAKRSSGLDTSSDSNVETAIRDIKSGWNLRFATVRLSVSFCCYYYIM